MSQTLTESNRNEPVPIVCDDCHNVSPILVKVKNGDRHVCKYGKQIFGLTQESKTYVSNEILKQELLDEIKAILYGHK